MGGRILNFLHARPHCDNNNNLNRGLEVSTFPDSEHYQDALCARAAAHAHSNQRPIQPTGQHTGRQAVRGGGTMMRSTRGPEDPWLHEGMKDEEDEVSVWGTSTL